MKDLDIECFIPQEFKDRSESESQKDDFDYDNFSNDEEPKSEKSDSRYQDTPRQDTEATENVNTAASPSQGGTLDAPDQEEEPKNVGDEEMTDVADEKALPEDESASKEATEVNAQTPMDE